MGAPSSPALESGGRSSTSEGHTVEAARPRYPGFWVLLLVWTAVGVVTSTPYYFVTPAGRQAPNPIDMLPSVVSYYPWIALTMIVFRLEARFPLGGARWPRSFARLAITSVPLCLVASPAMIGCFVGSLMLLGVQIWFPLGLGLWFKDVFVAQMLFWCAVAGGYVIRTRFQLQEQERRMSRLALEKSQLEAGLNQAQLDVLRARLNPHFLFNSLQNISVLTREDPQAASRMLVRLGDLLRSVLRHDSSPESTLAQEVELTRSYVELERIRFGDRLQVGFQVSSAVEDALVPCFLLQPLIENAIVHGLRGAKKTGVITVSAAKEANDLVLMVTDNGIGPPQRPDGEIRVGVGLGSTCERLARMYPDRHTFSMQRPPEGGTQVRVTIPLRFEEAGDHHDGYPAGPGR
jgi:two-component system LytT family sensor kinase